MKTSAKFLLNSAQNISSLKEDSGLGLNQLFYMF